MTFKLARVVAIAALAASATPSVHAQVNSTEGNALVFQVNGTEYARISGTSGFVGIGTTGPIGALHVSGSSAVFETGTNRKAIISTLATLPNIGGATTYAASIGFSRETDGTNNIAGMGLFNATNLFLGAYSDVVIGSGAASVYSNALI